LTATYAGDGSYNGSTSTAVTHTVGKAAGLVNINNIPGVAIYGGSFTPTFDKLGDGATSVTSLTASTCKVGGTVVNFVGYGYCILQASVAEGTNYLAGTGNAQPLTIGVLSGAVNINNIPGKAVYGGSFTPTFTKLGDGMALVTSLTTGTCTVTAGVVNYISAGLCTLQASLEKGSIYPAATGMPQFFIIGKAAGSVGINNIPGSAVYGGSFIPTFAKLGEGITFATSLTPGICTVTAGMVNYISVGTCFLQASVAEGTNYLTATGTWQFFTISNVR
jgi:hypothetical protein